MNGVVEYRCHMPHVIDREDGVEELALLSVVLA